MSSPLETELARALTGAADDAPPPGEDFVTGVRHRQRTRHRRRVTAVAACAVALTTAGTVTAVRVAAPPPDHRLGYALSPDRIPNFANLAAVEKVWPDAVHRLPDTLPDGSKYSVVAVLGSDRYLVGAAEMMSPAGGPSIFDVRSGTVTTLATPATTEGVAEPRVLMSKVVGDQAMWLLEGFRRNAPFREIWAAPLDGGEARRLDAVPDGASPRFSPAGDAVVWEVYEHSDEPFDSSNPPRTVVRRLPLSGGPAADLPGSAGFSLAHVAPWITTQIMMSGVNPATSGVLWNVATGERLRWTANEKVQFLTCGPTWCTGEGSGGKVALQRLDGRGYVELPYTGKLSPTADGRLAVGSLQVGNTVVQVVWDRETGRAAAVTRREASGGAVAPPVISSGGGSADFEPSVLTWRPTGDSLMVLDLKAIK